MPLDTLEEKQYAEIAKKLITEYFRNGFQSLSKKDLDLLIFLLVYKELVKKDDINFSLAKRLKIVPSRLKNLILNARFRWDDISDDAVIKDIICRFVKNLDANIENNNRDDKRLEILLENPIEKEVFISQIKNLKSIPQLTHNDEVVIVSLSAFLELLNNFGGQQGKASAKHLDTYKGLIEKSVKSWKEKKKVTWKDFSQLLAEVKNKADKRFTNDPVGVLSELATGIIRLGGDVVKLIAA